jgi:hypothetical protein
VAHILKCGTAYGLVEVVNIAWCPRYTKASKLVQLVEVSVEALRSQDLTLRLAFAAPGMGKAGEGSKPRDKGLYQPAKHTLVVSVELDGTGADLARVVARLTAISEIVADTD